MAKMMVCAIYDRKVDTHSTRSLSLFENDDIAKRAIHSTVLDANSGDYSRYASDFSLWHVGDFDPETGDLAGLGMNRRKVCEFDSFLTQPKEG